MKKRLLILLISIATLILIAPPVVSMSKQTERGPASQAPDGGSPAPASVTTPNDNVELVGHIGGATLAVFVQGNYAYVTAGSDGLRVVDVSDPSVPTEVGFYDTPGLAKNLAQAGDYAYVADYDAGLRVVDVSDPVSPTEVGFYNTPRYVESVAVAQAGDYAYIAAGADGLRVVDVSDPFSPTEVGFYDTPGYAWDVAQAGDYAYVADHDAGLRVVDVSNPVSPTEVGVYDMQYATDVALAGDYAYIVGPSLLVVDISNPSAPTQAGFYFIHGWAEGVAQAGDYAYIAAAEIGLRVVDVSDLSAPSEVGFYVTQEDAVGVCVSGDIIYVADVHEGLFLLRYTGGGPGATYAISGQVADDLDSPIADVTVAAGAGGSAVTDTSGNYTITDLITGAYTLVPTKVGYVFDPISYTVSVPPDAIQNFTGYPALEQPKITKTVIPTGQVHYGNEITYTLVVSSAPGTQIRLYDPLTQTTFLRFVEPVEGILHANGAVTGSLTVTPSNQITISFVVQAGVSGSTSLIEDIVNRACVYPFGGTLGGCIWSEPVINPAFRPYNLYLPIVRRNN